jgi:hypothetical protein
MIWLMLVELTLAVGLVLADWLWVLSGPVRLAGLTAMVGIGLGILYRCFIHPVRKLHRLDAAADVESGFPELGQRVRTTVEYTESTLAASPASPGLVRALLNDTEQRTSRLSFNRIIPWKAMWWPAIGLAIFLSVVVVSLTRNAELRTAGLRLFLWPAQYTQLKVVPGDHTVKASSDVTIQATLTGRPVYSVELQFRPADSHEAWTHLSLAPQDADPPQKLIGTLETTLTNCQKDLEYRVVAGPLESPIFGLKVLHPLELKIVEAQIVPPSYTRKTPTLVSEGNFKVIAGSRVLFRFVLDRAPKTAKLLTFSASESMQQKGSGDSLGLDIEGDTLTGTLAMVEKEIEYEVFAESADGMRLEASRYHIQVQPDRPPTIRFIKPEEQIEVTPTTEVNMRLEARDDFGLAKVGIVYQISNGPKKTLYMNEDPTQPPSLTINDTLLLEAQTLIFQDSLTYYAFAEDNHPAHPHRTRTELQFIDIRPFKRSYQLLKTGGS